MKENINGIVLMPGEGQSLTLGGVRVNLKTVSTDTGGKWSMVEYNAPPHFAGPPLHWHRHTAEAFYVLEGNPTFQIGDSVIKSEPGAFIYVPKGKAHTFANLEDKPAKFLTIIVPGGMERYWVEMADMESESEWPSSVSMASRYDHYEAELAG